MIRSSDLTDQDFLNLKATIDAIVGKDLKAAVDALLGDYSRIPALVSEVLDNSRLRQFLDDFDRVAGAGTLFGDVCDATRADVETARRDAARERLFQRLVVEPKRPAVRAVWTQIAKERGTHPWQLIAELLPAAILLVLSEIDKPQAIREGQVWIKEPDGTKAICVPEDHYTIPERARFERFLRQRIRDRIEGELLQQAGIEPRPTSEAEVPSDQLQGVVDRAAFKEWRAEGPTADADSRLDLLDRVVTPDDRDLFERAELGGLNARDRKRLERSRKNLRVALSQKR